MAKSPPKRPQDLNLDNAQAIKLLNFLRPITAKIMAARIPDSILRIVDCGHLFLLTRAGVLAPEIERFFAEKGKSDL